MSTKSDTLTLTVQDAWGLADVLRHRVPCAPDCEYCGEPSGDRPRRVGYKLAAKVQRSLLNLQKRQGGKETIEIDEHEAWMIYRYLPSTAYQGARDLLMQVFEIIVGHTTSTELPSWMEDVDLN